MKIIAPHPSVRVALGDDDHADFRAMTVAEAHENPYRGPLLAYFDSDMPYPVVMLRTTLMLAEDCSVAEIGERKAKLRDAARAASRALESLCATHVVTTDMEHLVEVAKCPHRAAGACDECVTRVSDLRGKT